MIDPFLALAAAAEQIRTGDVDEVEFAWTHDYPDEGSAHLTITVRREVRHLDIVTPGEP